MSLCINLSCLNPENPDSLLFCQACSTELLLAGRYRVTRLLSNKGGFGKTYEVTHNGTAKVLKVLINNDPKVVELFEQEAQVLQTLNHPGIPKGEGYFTCFLKNSETVLHCLVMQKIEGLDLDEYLQQRGNRPIDQKLALEWLVQLTEILHEVHRQQFFHRDIKPSNIILKTDGQLVLIDFGTVREVTATYRMKQSAGQVTSIASAGFTPPEQLNYQAVPQSDFYALGRTFVYLLTGKSPTDPSIYDPLNDELHWRDGAPNISPQLADFIDKLMMRSANQRPANTGEILQRLAELDQIINPPPPPREILPRDEILPRETITVAPPTVLPAKPVKPVPAMGSLTRRQLLRWTGYGGVGVVGAGIIHQIFKSTILVSKGGQAALNLRPFTFDVVNVDAQGSETSRKRRQAEFFTEKLGGAILEMVAIPGGTFQMGSPDTERDRSFDESPQHSRTIAPFYLGKFPVTQAQWKAVAALPQVSRELNPEPSNFKGDNLPVEQISWHDAAEFCARLSKKTGRTYRLPSEAEWEYACRAGTTSPFHSGEIITTDLANYDGGASYGVGIQGVSRQETTPVGSFPANAFGLHDMHGNVWEWCADHWHDYYKDAPSDGRAWLDSNVSGNHARLLRGGSWSHSIEDCRSANRLKNEPELGSNNIGFRVAFS